MNPRIARFISVGAGGFAVQATVLATLTGGAGWALVPATVVAVEAAILVTYVCHERWTWRDRIGRNERVARLGRFHVSNGLTSLAGNVVLTSLGVDVLRLGAVEANLAAVVLLAGINYMTADRWIFSSRTVASGFAATLLSASPLEAAPGAAAIGAWDHHVRLVEATLAQHEQDEPTLPAGRARRPGGRALALALAQPRRPRLILPIAAPLIDRVGRESMLRTLATVERAIGVAAAAGASRKAERADRDRRGSKGGADALGQAVRAGSIAVDAQRVDW